MPCLGAIEEKVFAFLHASFRLNQRQLKTEFENLLSDLKQIEKNRFAIRAFAYLDIILWLESKIYGASVQDIIQRKFQAGLPALQVQRYLLEA